jgi:protein-S-isoprenylcysteine O-methyltransferase Ste14
LLHILVFYLIFVAVALVFPTVRVRRKTGVNPLVIPAKDDAEGFVGRMFKWLVAALGFYLAAGAARLTDGVGQMALPDGRHAIGWAMLVISLVWVVIAQWQMGESWRVGIDSRMKTGLVRGGLFRVSRNPIFLGMMVQLAGLFLLIPDAITLLVMVSGYLLISVQIRLEEAHLRGLHGPDYAMFERSVRRWI